MQQFHHQMRLAERGAARHGRAHGGGNRGVQKIDIQADMQQAARQGLLDYNTGRIAPSKTGQRFLNRLLQLFLKNPENL